MKTLLHIQVRGFGVCFLGRPIASDILGGCKKIRHVFFCTDARQSFTLFEIHPSTCASCLSRKDNDVRALPRRVRGILTLSSSSSSSDNQSSIRLPIGRRTRHHGGRGRGKHRRRGDYQRDRRVSKAFFFIPFSFHF